MVLLTKAQNKQDAVLHTGRVEHFDDDLQLSVCRRLSTFHVALENILQTLDSQVHVHSAGDQLNDAFPLQSFQHRTQRGANSSSFNENW